MDIQREKDAFESWHAQGKRGNPPPPLMQLEELPKCYQTNEPFDIKEVEDPVEDCRQHCRNIVSYNNGLSDDTWAMVCFSILKKIHFYFPNLYSQALEEERTSRNFLNMPKIKRSDAYKTNFSKKQCVRTRNMNNLHQTGSQAHIRKITQC